MNDMVKKYFKRVTFICVLLALNVVGFMAAKYYFTDQSSNPNHFEPGILDKMKQNGPVLVHPSDFLQFGLEVIKDLGK